MADPLSITASLLAISTAAIQTTKSLYETIQRYRVRDKTLTRLQHELDDLTKILECLTRADDAEESLLALLRGPIERCSQVCSEFESSMEVFGKGSKTGFRDWTRMEFMRGDINDFIETIAGYKSTISVGLGTITMHKAQVSHEVLLEYNEMIQDTTYNLNLQLQRIDEKMTQLTKEPGDARSVDTDLDDERAVTRQCLRICEEARSYLQNISAGASPLLDETSQSAVPEQFFEAQMRVRQTLDETRDSFSRTSGHLSRRLEALVQGRDSDNDHERLKLQSDIETYKQCLRVCNTANEISREKIYRIGEVVADGDSDQVVVTTLADLFDIGKATSKNNSAQLIGSMTAESLRHLTDKRYDSRFGTISSNSNTPRVDIITDPQSSSEISHNKPPPPRQAAHSDRVSEPRSRQGKPLSNTVKKRTSNGDAESS